MQGRPELGGARRHGCWDARACLHACTHAHAHTLWAQSGPCTCSTAQPGIQGKLEPGGARRRALVRACLHTTAAWPHALAHTRCVPLRLSQLGLQGVTPHMIHTLRSSFACLEKCVTSRARASPIFSVARNAPPNLSLQELYCCCVRERAPKIEASPRSTREDWHARNRACKRSRQGQGWRVWGRCGGVGGAIEASEWGRTRAGSLEHPRKQAQPLLLVGK